jgi:hypothetical protein
MGLRLKRNHTIVIVLAAALLAAGLTGCSGEISAAPDGSAETQQTSETTAEVPAPDGTIETQQTLETTAAVAATDTVARPEGWSEETHGNGTEPNYDVVFPDNKVNGRSVY